MRHSAIKTAPTVTHREIPSWVKFCNRWCCRQRKHERSVVANNFMAGAAALFASKLLEYPGP